MASRLFSVIFPVAHLRGWFAAIIAFALSDHINAQQQPPPLPAGAQSFTDATTKLIAAINADDQPAIQQMFNEAMQKALPAEKTGPFFRGLLSAKGNLQAAGAPEVSGAAAKVRVTAERGDWQFEITLDPSDKIAGLRVLPGDDKPGRNEEPSPATTQASDEATTYFALRRSKDRLTQQVAERYFNLVKLQEWSDATGKFKTNAKYVAHDPDMQWVKLAASKGSGASRDVKELTVPVGRLSKTCQSRVKQISTLQKKLDELAAAAENSDGAGQPGAGGLPEGDRGAPMVDEYGVQPRGRDHGRVDQAGVTESGPAEVDRGPAAPASSQPEVVVEGEADPDPLGFGETPPAPAAGPNAATFDAQLPAGEVAAPAGDAPQDEFRPGPVPPSPEPARPRDEFDPGDADPVQWRSSYANFRANFRVDFTTGNMVWQNLDALRIMGQTAAPNESAPEGEAEAVQKRAAALADQLGEVKWEATFQGMRGAEGHLLILLDVPPLPAPLQIEFRLDQKDRATAAEWPQFSAGNRVSFTGRLAMSGPTSIVVWVREPKLLEGTLKPQRNR